ncbi:hypothetical protein E5221_22865 [Pseudomonas sp. A2]|nr:hypothetical protein E5221_22865 [Pseudomonas sp. A2]
MRWLRAHAVPVGAAVAANTGAAGAMHRTGCFAGLPAPTGTTLASGSRCTCGSGRGREHRRSRCHPLRRLLRGLARSHRYCAGFGITLYLWERSWPRTPAQPVPYTARRTFIQKPRYTSKNVTWQLSPPAGWPCECPGSPPGARAFPGSAGY